MPSPVSFPPKSFSSFYAAVDAFEAQPSPPPLVLFQADDTETVDVIGTLRDYHHALKQRMSTITADGFVTLLYTDGDSDNPRVVTLRRDVALKAMSEWSPRSTDWDTALMHALVFAWYDVAPHYLLTHRDGIDVVAWSERAGERATRLNDSGRTVTACRLVQMEAQSRLTVSDVPLKEKTIYYVD